MIVLRQGRAKTILENSLDGALNAVEIYNKPRTKFRVENYIVLMIIAWTKLFHSYFQAKIGDRYYYKEKNGRYSLKNGEKRAWELDKCISEYQKMNTENKLSGAVVENLKFFIGIRNKIEHRYWYGSSLDILLFGECQALLYNYENLVVKIYGEDYSINTCLAYALQFSHLRANSQIRAQRELLSKDMEDIKKYIDKYKTNLPQEIYDSQEYSIKLLQIPKVSNTNKKDLAIEFVNWNSLSDEDKQNYEKVTTIIKDKIITNTVANSNLLRPKKVVDLVNEKTKADLNVSNHTRLWKSFRIRPYEGDPTIVKTIDKYCVFDEAHNDYLYTSEWVDFICHLIKNKGFTHDVIIEKCKGNLLIGDYI